MSGILETNVIDAYLDMNFFFSKGINSDNRLSEFISNVCEYQGMTTYDPESQSTKFFDQLFCDSNLFKILFTDDLNSKCNSVDHYILNVKRCRLEFSPTQVKFKYDKYLRTNGLKYLTKQGTELFLDNEKDIYMVGILRDSKKYTYQTDNSIHDLPLEENDFKENYVDLFDTFPILSQLIIIELFYLHYNLEDDFVKYDIIMAIIKKLQGLDKNVPYNLTCILYAYLVLVKISVTKINRDDAVYPADYWENE
jgi:hypothetical protein